MNTDAINKLTTGDKVVNITTKRSYMIAVVSPKIDGILTIEELNPITDWEMGVSRLFVSDEEQRNIAKYHVKMKEATINKNK